MKYRSFLYLITLAVLWSIIGCEYGNGIHTQWNTVRNMCGEVHGVVAVDIRNRIGQYFREEICIDTEGRRHGSYKLWYFDMNGSWIIRAGNYEHNFPAGPWSEATSHVPPDRQKFIPQTLNFDRTKPCPDLPLPTQGP